MSDDRRHAVFMMLAALVLSAIGLGLLWRVDGLRSELRTCTFLLTGEVPKP